MCSGKHKKGLFLGEGGKMIKKLGTEARKDIEEFLGQKVFLELFVKVRPKWRDNEMQLKEYGYYSFKDTKYSNNKFKFL